ncbi:MAG TPA: ribose-5-phosphate isomerase RpiA [Geminicoccaceae bacterium]|nr:ribose-5-phosphate isomerase RpiA [Geminicoccaceae bacterium]
MSRTSKPEQDHLKRLAAAAAIAEVEDGMVLGLGSGSTAAFAVEALAARVGKGLDVVAIPTSERTGTLARRLGIRLTNFAEHRKIDLTIDGADEVEIGTLNLIKGRGGALLREKIVASASDRMVVIVDEGKRVDRLGRLAPVPVEIVAFGWQVTLDRLADLGARPTLRVVGDEPFRTDSGNHIADCAFGEIGDAADLERRLAAITGVVESGLFVGLAARVIVGTRSGMQVLER